MGHVDEGELNAALVFPVRDLAEARVVGKSFVLDHGLILKGWFAIVQTSFDDSARDPGFVLGELGICLGAADISLVAFRMMGRLDHDASMVADDGSKVVILRPLLDGLLADLLQMPVQVVGFLGIPGTEHSFH